MDGCGYNWDGISDSSTLRFTSDIGPHKLSSTPPDGSTGSINDTGIVMVFDRAVEQGTGATNIYKVDGTLVATFPTTDARVNLTN